MGFSRCHAMPGSPFATLSFLDMHNCPFLLCNFFQKGVAKNTMNLVETALTEKVDISGKELVDHIKAAGLEEEIEYLAMYERE